MPRCPPVLYRYPCTVSRQAFCFYACSSVCRELSVKFVRFYKNAISRVILGKNFKKPLAIFVPKWYVVSNKSETWIHLHLWSSNFGSARAFVFDLAIFFIYLLIIYPACPARDEKSDDPPARVIAFSFIYLQKQNAPSPRRRVGALCA